MKLIFRRLLPLLIGALLCVAAIAKMHVLFEPLSMASHSDLSALGIFGLMLIEITIAWWLVSGWKPLLAWRVSQFMFLLFGVVSGLKWLNGDTDCDCFGPGVKVPPALMTIFDLAIVLALELLFRLNDPSIKPRLAKCAFEDFTLSDKTKKAMESGGFEFVLVSLMLLSVLVLLVAIQRNKTIVIRMDDEGWNEVDWRKDSKALGITKVLPLRMVPGKPLFLSWASPSDKQILQEPYILALMVNGNCEHCRTLVSKLSQHEFVSPKVPLVVVDFNRHLVGTSDEIRGKFEDDLTELTRHPGIRHLKTGHRCAIQMVAPALLELENGIVNSIKTDSEEIRRSLLGENYDYSPNKK
jgi:hypothetical protein